MANIDLYEAYHKKIKLQKRIIDINDFTYKNILKKINKFLPKSGNLLDIGSATGTLAFYFRSRGLKVDGIEISKNAINFSNLNKKNLGLNNINFINTTIENYTSKNKYKVITCFEVLEHLKDDKYILRKIRGYMNKRSVFMLSVPSSNAPLYRLGLLKKFDYKVGHLRRYSISDIKQILFSSGFNILRIFKTEGLIRNIIYTNPLFGFITKFTRFYFFNNVISYLDDSLVKVFGESQLIVIANKK